MDHYTRSEILRVSRIAVAAIIFCVLTTAVTAGILLVTATPYACPAVDRTPARYAK